VDFQRELGRMAPHRSRTSREELCYHFVIDYFVYPKGIMGDIPPFAVGRPGWDIWSYKPSHCLETIHG